MSAGSVLPELLIISRSGRALAASANRAGYTCDVIDAFADADTERYARHVWSVESFDTETLTPLLEAWSCQRTRDRDTPAAIIVPGSGMEADPALVDFLQAYGTVATNSAKLVHELKAPGSFFPLLDRLGIDHPAISEGPVDEAHGDWLLKPIGAEGGGGIRVWSPDEPVPAGHYLQQRGEGLPVSVVFLADTRRARVIGFNHCLTLGQLNGNAADYRYAGAISWRPPDSLARSTEYALHELVRATGLRGLLGMDMLWNDDAMQVLEINPRPPASFELHENGDPGSGSLVAAHLSACAGVLSERLLADALLQDQCTGKLVVYVDEPLHIPASYAWPEWIVDRPAAGSRLEADTPICTIMSGVETPEACLESLQALRQDLLKNIKKHH